MLLKKFFIIFGSKGHFWFKNNQSFSPVPPLHLFPDPHRGSAPSKHQSFKGSLPTSVPRRLSKTTNTLNINRCTNSEHATGIKKKKNALSGFGSSPVHNRSKRLRFQSEKRQTRSAGRALCLAGTSFFIRTNVFCNRIFNIRMADCTWSASQPGCSRRSFSARGAFPAGDVSFRKEEKKKFTGLDL